MISRFFLSAFLGFTLCLAVLDPSPSANAQSAQTGLPIEKLVIRSGEQEHHFVVEIAATDQQRAHGLMFREEMAADQGMLFIFEGERNRSFWMKNTPLPLDIIYISSAGRIVSIAADTTPFSEAVIPSGAPARFVLELNGGTAEALGIEAGDDVSSPSIKSE